MEEIQETDMGRALLPAESGGLQTGVQMFDYYNHVPSLFCISSYNPHKLKQCGTLKGGYCSLILREAQKSNKNPFSTRAGYVTPRY